MPIICFDVDGTLIHKAGLLSDTPRYDVIDMFRWFENNGWQMVIWSEGGIDYAKHWAEKLGLEATIREKEYKQDTDVDIAVDDEEVLLGKVNVRVIDNTAWGLDETV